MKKYISAVTLFLFLLFLDQFSKILALSNLKGQMGYTIIKDVFTLEYLENYGAAFGVLQNKRLLLLSITIIMLVVLAAAYVWLPSDKHFTPLRILDISLAAGAVGNMIDRIFRGYVIDFLYFKYINFPVFNIADCYVVISSGILFFLLLFYYKDEEFKKEKLQKK